MKNRTRVCFTAHPCFSFLGILVLLLSLGACNRQESGGGPVPIELMTWDGFVLPGTYSRGAGEAPGGIILLHRYSFDQSSWAPYITTLNRAGYSTVNFDMRGHGGAAHPDINKSYSDFGVLDWKSCLYDIQAAKAYLVERGVGVDSMVVMGEDIGANLGLYYVLNDVEVGALVMVSPGLDYHGIETEGPMGLLKEHPLLLVAGEQDVYSASSALSLQKKAPNFAELRSYTTRAHGTDLFAAKPDALQQIVLWLHTTVPVGDPSV